MAYRDDKDAAFARADALQRELDQTKAELERTRDQLARSKRARESPAAPAARDDAEPTPPSRELNVAGPAIGCLVLFGALTALAVANRPHRSPPESRPAVEPPLHPLPSADPMEEYVLTEPCTLASDPPGAQVIARPVLFEEKVGTTPITKTLVQWTELGVLELRLDGYKPVETAIMTCGTTVKLSR